MPHTRVIPTWKAVAGAALLMGTAGAFAAAHDMHGMAMPAPSPSADPAAIAAEKPFLDGNNVAMATMMAGMAVAPTGDIDKDFVDMMVPHHQGAIDMAKLVLRYGKNQKLKYLAQEIVVTQQQEIAAMRLAVGETLPASRPAPTAAGE